MSTLASIFLTLLAALFPQWAAAETVKGSGTAATEQRQVAGFQSVAISVPGRLEVSQADVEKLTITADDNVLPLIETVVERGELRIRFRERHNINVRTKAPIRIVLSAKTVEALAVAGSGEVVAPALTARRMRVSISGSGDVTLGGKAQAIEVSIAGSGNLKAGRFEAQTAKVDIAGSGDSTLWVRDSLQASIAGSGDVRYYGDPAVTRSIVGSGDVRRAGAAPA